MISNTSDRIKELRKQIIAEKGKIDRAITTKMFLEQKIYNCSTKIQRARKEIIEMGGKIKQ